MSFRTRLTSFFILIVVVPMAAVGFLVFRLIDDSQTGTADARASGIAATAQSEYGNASSSRPRWTIEASELTAADYARSLAGSGIQVVVRSGAATLASTLPAAAHAALPNHPGTITIGPDSYRVVTQRFTGFPRNRVEVSILSNVDASGVGSLGEGRLLAGALIAAFLILAFFFALLASRALQGQLARFLEAARRLGSGDFSSPVPTVGSDEFAALGEEFNSMSRQLAHRLDELQQERARLRSSFRRIGEAFASGLDRDALLDLSLKTAMDAAEDDRGRVSARAGRDRLWWPHPRADHGVSRRTPLHRRRPGAAAPADLQRDPGPGQCQPASGDPVPGVH